MLRGVGGLKTSLFFFYLILVQYTWPLYTIISLRHIVVVVSGKSPPLNFRNRLLCCNYLYTVSSYFFLLRWIYKSYSYDALKTILIVSSYS